MEIAEYNMSYVDAMEGHEFEHFIAILLRNLGYQKVEVTRGSGDQGVDVLAEKDDIRYAVQCKCYTNDLGNTPVQEVNTGKMVYQCQIGVVVTNRYFTQGAKEAAKATGVLLWDRTKLEKMIAQVKTTSNAETLIQQNESSITLWNGNPLLKRGGIALKDKEWKKAIQFFDRVLNNDPENAEAYLGLVMAEAELSDKDEFIKVYYDYPYKLNKKNLNHVKEFASLELNTWFAQEDKKREKELEELEKKLEEDVIRLSPIRDSVKKVAFSIIAAGRYHIVGLKADGTVVATGSNQYKQCDVYSWHDIVAISCGDISTVGLKADGTVVVTGGGCNSGYNKEYISSWRDIVSVFHGYDCIVGLKADGTVVATGRTYDRLDISGWKDIVKVFCAASGIVGLKADGTVVFTDGGYHRVDISGWRDIVSVFHGYDCIVGLKADGTVVAANKEQCGYDEDGTVVATSKKQYNVSGWRDIVEVFCAGSGIIGLKADGTVVTDNMFNDEISNWTNIVSVTITNGVIVGLKSNGTVVTNKRITEIVARKEKITARRERYKEVKCQKEHLDLIEDIDAQIEAMTAISKWTDIVAVTAAAGDGYILGLKSDGSVVAVELAYRLLRKIVNNSLPNRVLELEWGLLNNIDTLKQKQSKAKAHIIEMAEAHVIEMAEAKRKERVHKKALLESEQDTLKTELASLKKLFTGKRRKEIGVRLAEIEMELKSL